MRTPEFMIRNAILHPEEEVRDVAASYYADAYSTDPAIMPLVIQAVEKYGRDTAFGLLRTAERLVQTPETLQWCMAELRREYDLKDIKQDNYRCAVAMILTGSDPHLLVPLHDDILALPAFPKQLHQDLILQADRASWDWATGWKMLQEWAEDAMDEDYFANWDSTQMSAIIRALGKFREDGGETVLNLLHRHYRGYDKRLMQWLEPQLVELAGEMRLESAIPLLIERLHEADDPVGDAVGPALAQIGTEEVILALAKDWSEGDESYRFSACEAFEHIHSDLSVQAAFDFLPEEESLEVACSLGFVLLSNFAEEGIGVVRDFVLDKGEGKYVRDVGDLRWRLIATATIMDRPFREYPAWYDEAVAKKWGFVNYERPRLADNLGPDQKMDEGEEEEWEDDAFEDDEPSVPPLVHKEKKVGRNDPCPCGSGKKYKKCCLHQKPFDPLNN